MKIRIESGQLIVELSFWEKVLSLHGDFVIPKSRVVGVERGRPPLIRWWWEVRVPGTFLPGMIKAGTYLVRERGREFWYWSRWREHMYTIELQDELYDRLVLASTEPVSEFDS